MALPSQPSPCDENQSIWLVTYGEEYVWDGEPSPASRWQRLKWRIESRVEDVLDAIDEAQDRIRRAWSVLRRGYYG